MGTVRVRVINRSKGSARIAFETGVVVDGGEEVTGTYDSGPLAPNTRTLYYAADVAGTIIEIFPEHSRDRAALGPGWSDGFSI